MILAVILFIVGLVLLPVVAFAAFDASGRAREADEAMNQRMTDGDVRRIPPGTGI